MYPRIACYAGNKGSGYPLTLTNTIGSPLNPDVINKLARYPLITLDITPWYNGVDDARIDGLLALRRARAGIKILFYQLAGWWYVGPEVPVHSSDKSWARHRWHAGLLATNGHGAPSGTGWWVRWENPATEARLTSLFVELAQSGLCDGLFLDYLWGQGEPAVKALQRMCHTVKQAGGRDFLLIGNSNHDVLNVSSMREGFPNYPVNELNIELWRGGRPHCTDDWLQAGTGHRDSNNPDTKRAARYALGTACIRSMICSFGPDRDLEVQPPYHTWWFPEYDGNELMVGWLGEPWGDARSLDDTNNHWQRDFIGGRVILNEAQTSFTIALPSGLCNLDGEVVGSVTVPARDAAFLIRPR